MIDSSQIGEQIGHLVFRCIEETTAKLIGIEHGHEHVEPFLGDVKYTEYPKQVVFYLLSFE